MHKLYEIVVYCPQHDCVLWFIFDIYSVISSWC